MASTKSSESHPPGSSMTAIKEVGQAFGLRRALSPPKRFWLSLICCAAIFIAVSIAAPLIGSAHIDYRRALNGQSPDHEIMFYARIPRVLLAILAGGALTLTGVLFQALLRDPLAEPFTLGISSGSSLGAVIAISLGWTTVAGIPAAWFTAFAGAAATLTIVLGIAFEGRR